MALPALTTRMRILRSDDHQLDAIRGAADLAFERLFAETRRRNTVAPDYDAR